MDGRVVAVDTECTGPDFAHGCAPFLVSAVDLEGHVSLWRWNVDPVSRRVLYDKAGIESLYHFLLGFETFVFHNAAFDIKALCAIHPKFLDLFLSRNIEDTMLAAHVLNSQFTKSLKELSVFYLGIPPTDENELEEAVKACRKEADTWCIARAGMKQAPLVTGKLYKMDSWIPRQLAAQRNLPKSHPWWDVAENYAASDVRRTMGLFKLFRQAFARYDEQLYKNYQAEIALVPVIVKMEQEGVSLRYRALCRMAQKFRKEASELETEFRRLTRVENINSTKRLGDYFFNHCKLRPTKVTKTGKGSLDEESLRELFEHNQESPFARHLDLLIRYRRVVTGLRYLTQYYKAAVHSGRGRWVIHTNYNQVGTDTTRMSSSRPNLQNIGKDSEYNLREAFGPSPGYVWYAYDYSQLQLRIFAAASGDIYMQEAFEKGYDFHTYVAQRIFNTSRPTDLERRVAKNINFGLIFGAGAEKINRMSGMEDAYGEFVKAFPSVHRFMRSVIEQVRLRGYVCTLGGYNLVVPLDKPYVGVCYIVQGTEGEIVKRAMVESHKYLAGRGTLILQIHDELVFQFRRGQDTMEILRGLKDILEAAGTAVGVRTPVSVKRITGSFAKGEEITL